MGNDSEIQTIFNPRLSICGTPGSNLTRDHNSAESGNAGEDSIAPSFAKKKSCFERAGNACFSKSARKIYCGVCVTVCITASWVATTHCIKYLYHPYVIIPSRNISIVSLRMEQWRLYNAPFFTTWFCTNWMVLFFPVYYFCQLLSKEPQNPSQIFCDSIRNFRSCDYSIGRFIVRCGIFCALWVSSNYVYICSLRVLLATDVIAIYATNVAFVYVLSWVILHDQFVGLRIIAVILCYTGVALLAYMDGVSRSPTLSSVLLATGAACGTAIFKVMFQRIFGEVTFGQTSIFLSLIGILNAILCWPICLGLYFSGIEVLHWERLPWTVLLSASILYLANNVMVNFGIAITYDLFIALAFITSVPVSASLDVVLYGTHFFGMKLAGIILIGIGFFLVMFPNNWPDYITRLLRSIILMSRKARWNRKNRNIPINNHRNDTDYRTGYIRSHLRSPSGRVR